MNQKGNEIGVVSPRMEREVGLSVQALTDIFLLESVKGFGPQKFKELHELQIPIAAVLRESNKLPLRGKRAEGFKTAISKLNSGDRRKCRERAEKQILTANSLGGHIVSYNHHAYPPNVYNSNLPLPVIYVRGSLSNLKEVRTVACVGSRKIRNPYTDLLESFVEAAVHENFVIVSGFALGADTIGHRRTFEEGGRTICVMPGGLDRPFPPENKELWLRFLVDPRVTFVSEFGFGMPTSSLNLKKRNKLISALSKGVLVAQSGDKGGAMNAYRFAVEQSKPVATFSPDVTEATTGNQQILMDGRPQSVCFPHSANSFQFSAWLVRLSSSI